MKRPPAPSENVLEAVGSTPLIRLRRITRGIRTPVYGKAENLNPGGSVKDRIALSMIEAAEARRARAEIKELLKNATITLPELFERAETDEHVGGQG